MYIESLNQQMMRSNLLRHNSDSNNCRFPLQNDIVVIDALCLMLKNDTAQQD
jgi:hypothetical protein